VEPLSRPDPRPAVGERLRSWITWFGVGRLICTVVATITVVAGGAWLVRTPAPPTEANLPQATAAVAASAASTVPPPATSVAPTVPARILVHVAGAVVEPGVYELANGARIRDALAAAGGPRAAADWNALNLAAPIADGSRVYVPEAGEAITGALVSGPPVTVAGDGAGDVAPSLSGPVDLNRASADELDVLPGIGPATAAAIVDERNRNGPFASVDDLERVPGIGPAKLAAVRDLVTT
jgi:competence protein ComEA